MARLGQANQQAAYMYEEELSRMPKAELRTQKAGRSIQRRWHLRPRYFRVRTRSKTASCWRDFISLLAGDTDRGLKDRKIRVYYCCEKWLFVRRRQEGEEKVSKKKVEMEMVM